LRIEDLKESRQEAASSPATNSGQAGRRRRDNAHCAFINYHLAFYLNVSISVTCEFSMINANCEMRNDD